MNTGTATGNTKACSYSNTGTFEHSGQHTAAASCSDYHCFQCYWQRFVGGVHRLRNDHSGIHSRLRELYYEWKNPALFPGKRAAAEPFCYLEYCNSESRLTCCHHIFIKVNMSHRCSGNRANVARLRRWLHLMYQFSLSRVSFQNV
jgi:hypothetical protein